VAEPKSRKRDNGFSGEVKITKLRDKLDCWKNIFIPIGEFRRKRCPVILPLLINTDFKIRISQILQLGD